MKSLFEQFDGTYHNESNYLIPNLALPESEENDIGIYGELHLHFLQEHRRLTYINLLTSEVLNKYLSEIDKQARVRFWQIVKQLKITQDITEQLKADSPMEWVRKMNCVMMKRYTEIKELTPAIVNEFIDYIMVSKKQVIDGKTAYPIDIYYNGVCIITAPSAEEYEKMFQERLKQKRAEEQKTA